MNFKVAHIVSGHNDKDTFFDVLPDENVEKFDTDFENVDQVIQYLFNQKSDNIFLVLYKNAPFTIQGSYKNTSGWGCWVRFNFRKEDEGKYGIAMKSESIRALNQQECKDILSQLLPAIDRAMEEQEELKEVA